MVFAAQQLFQLRLELAHILEVPIHTGKPDIRHRIDVLQPRHNQLAHLAGRALPLRRIDDIRLGLIHNLLQLQRRNRPLLAGMQQPAQNLLPVELLAPSVFLHHHVRNLVDPLVRRKPLVAAFALAPAANRVRLFTLA